MKFARNECIPQSIEIAEERNLYKKEIFTRRPLDNNSMLRSDDLKSEPETHDLSWFKAVLAGGAAAGSAVCSRSDMEGARV
ncbi:MAG: hypothetical protein L0229_29590 [Blastocatellia bacterium]|nr:hypothetical protein [Blastocatellia bacterium]